MNIKSGNTRRVFPYLRVTNFLGICLVSLAYIQPCASVQALSGTDDVGMYGSRTISSLADKAARALKTSQWGEAQGYYRQLMAKRPKEDDFYFGYFKASRMMNQWAEVALALEQLFKYKPQYKDRLLFEYGECLYNLNRYREAEPVLKKSLNIIDQESIVDKQVKKIINKGLIVHNPVKGDIIKPVYKVYKEPAPYVPVDETKIHPGTSDVELAVKHAYTRSESVVVAVYKGYETSKDIITYYNPPQANYKIVKYLKGPPLNRALP